MYVRYRRSLPGAGGEEFTCRLLASTARVCQVDRFSTPRSELSGLVVRMRLVTNCLPGMTESPASISLMGDSQCTISAVECETRVLGQWFGNIVSEVHKYMQDWRSRYISVAELNHWPGITNPADIVTKDKAKPSDLLAGRTS